MEKEVLDDEEEDNEKEGEEDDGPKIEDVTKEDDDKEKTKKTNKIKEVTHNWDHLNSQKSICMRKADEVTPEEY